MPHILCVSDSHEFRVETQMATWVEGNSSVGISTSRAELRCPYGLDRIFGCIAVVLPVLFGALSTASLCQSGRCTATSFDCLNNSGLKRTERSEILKQKGVLVNSGSPQISRYPKGKGR